MKAKTNYLMILLFLTSVSARTQEVNQKTFQTYLQTVYDAYTQGGFGALKKYYTPTSSEIDPMGNVAQGISTLEKNYAMMDAMLEDKPRFTFQLTSWRLVNPDVALIFWDSEDEFKIQGQWLKSKNTASAVLVKKGGQWLIENAQLTPKMDMVDPESDLAAIKAMGIEAYEAFRMKDAPRFGNIFTNDVVFIGPHGEMLKGKQQVIDMHSWLFKQWSDTPEAKVEVMDNDVKFIDNNTAVCSWKDVIKFQNLGKEVTESRSFVNTCIKKDGKWLSASLSLTPVVTPPANPGNE